VEHGITSKHLRNGMEELSTMYRGKVIGGVDFGKIYAEFQSHK
jgi:putative hydrolase of HD superfamily